MSTAGTINGNLDIRVAVDTESLPWTASPSGTVYRKRVHLDGPAGTYLLNPEGFRHAPFSRGGCMLFVKLRQYPGRTREHVAIRTDLLPWQPAARAGVGVRPLYLQAGFADSMRLDALSSAVTAFRTSSAMRLRASSSTASARRR